MKVNFLILNYNSFNLTNKLIDIVKNYQLVDKIIIVDNNSTDDSKEKLNKILNDKIICIYNDKNLGYSKGNNVGLKYSVEVLNSDYVILANPDIYVDELTLDECINTLKSNSNCAIVSPKINNINSKGDIAWKIPSYYNDIFSLFFLTNKIMNRNLVYKKEEFNKVTTEVEVLPGSLLVMNCKMLKEIGYFDENTFLYCEERILSSKLKKNGYISILLNNYTYVHEHGTIIKKQLKSKINQYKILNESKRYFLLEYCKVGRIKIKIFDIMCKLSLLEKCLIDLIK